MTPAVTQPGTLQVRVSDDRLTAELCIPTAAPDDAATPDAARALLEAQKIAWTDDVAAAVTALLAQQRPPDRPLVGVVVRGEAPRPGAHGRLEWHVEKPRKSNPDGSISHYDRCAFIFVETDQPLGRIFPPKPGVDGRDVTGAPIHAEPGVAVDLQLDDSIKRQPDGTLVAARAGRLVRTPNSARVHELLEVKCVDFSTGNLDFRGSILIREGVKDRFIVKASEAVEVHGLVEAAAFECAGDLVLEGGFAGREFGHASVGGNFHARYLDGVTADIRGDLVVVREVINCDVTVHGNAELPKGSVIGGRCVVAKSLHVGSLGSGGGVATEVVVGSVPRLQPMLEQLDKLRRDYQRQIDLVVQKQQMIYGLPDDVRGNATNMRRMGKFAHLLAPLQNQLDRANAAEAALRHKIEQLRVVDVSIEKMLHEGVIIRDGPTYYRVFQAVIGPVKIVLDHDGALVLRSSHGAGQPLTAIAEPLAAELHAAA